jgi:hypothetical protein
MKRALWLLLLLLSWSRGAAAHEVGLSQGQYRRHANVLDVELVLAQRDAASLIARLDPERDGSIDARELAPAREELERLVLGSIAIGGNSGACLPQLTRAAVTERDGLLVAGQLRCAPSDATWHVTLGFVEQLARGHRHAAHVASGSSVRDELVYGDTPTLDIALEAAATGGAGKPTRAGGFLRLGFEHILGGYDHLAFLVALVLAGGKLRSLLGVVTAFTVGHSLSLALAVLGVWAPSARLVEPGIALSIGYVAIENLAGLDPSKRWRVTLPFGLVHGFGFSGALLDVGLRRADVPSALLFFNLGVELGQIGLLCLALPLIGALRDWRRLPRWTLPALNAALVALSLVWFMQRVQHADAPVASSGPTSARRPVLGSATPAPLAQRLCAALHVMPGRRTAECCETPPNTYLYEECVAVVSRSLAAGSSELAPAAISACERAMEAQLTGCDWARPGLPVAPDACQGLIEGRVPSGGACRSSLECAANLHCLVAAGGAQGRCVPPAALGASCGRSSDAMAAYVLDRQVEAAHPPCAEFCSLVSHQCEPSPVEGAACRASVNCATGQHCSKGACRSGPAATELAGTGEACLTDFECARGGCIASATGGSGVCGGRCSTAPLLAAFPR